MSKNKLPWFTFYPRDFLSSVMHLSNQDVGVYVRLLLFYYAEGGAMPHEIEEVRALVHARTPAEHAALDRILERFFERTPDKDGVMTWRQGRADAEIVRSAEKHATAVEKSQRANAIRWEREKASSAPEDDSRSAPPRILVGLPGGSKPQPQPQPQLQQQPGPPVGGGGVPSVASLPTAPVAPASPRRPGPVGGEPSAKTKQPLTSIHAGVRLPPDWQDSLQRLRPDLTDPLAVAQAYLAAPHENRPRKPSVADDAARWQTFLKFYGRKNAAPASQHRTH